MTAAGGWRQVPAPIDHGGERDPLIALALTLWIALAGPVARAAALPASRPLPVLGIGLVALAIGSRLPARWWPARLGLAAGAGATVYVTEGRVLAIWLTAGLLLAWWVVAQHPPLPFLPPPGLGAAPPVAVLCGLAIFRGAREFTTWEPFVPLALAFAIPLISRLGGGFIDRVGRRLGAAVGDGLAAACFGVLGVFAVAVPWALQRVVRADPLRATGRWADRERRPLQPAQPWAADPAPVPTSRVRTVVSYGVVVVALGLLAVPVARDRSGSAAAATRGSSAPVLGVPDPGAPIPAAYRGDEWYPAFREDMAWIMNERVALRPLEIYKLLDAETRTVAIEDGHRQGWTPGSCDCTRLTVWLYGGGGAFGMGQRDDHTIASELARVAEEDGVVLDVVNRGMPGELHWRRALRFAWDLTTEEAPDLVVFYDGAEEVRAELALQDREAGNARAPFEPLSEQIYDELLQVPPGRPEAPAGTSWEGWPTVDDLGTTGAPGALAVARYDRSRQLSRTTARAADIPVRYAWEPSRSTRTDREPDAAGDPDEPRLSAAFAGAAADLPDDVIDLTAALDDVDEPIYADATHLDEDGARLIAAALYRALRTDLRELRDRAGGG